MVNGITRIRKGEEIKYIAGDGPVSEVYMKTNNVLHCSRGLIYFKRQLSDMSEFFEFSQSLIVNMNYINHVDSRNMEIVLRCGKVLYMSRRGKQQFNKHCKSLDKIKD